MNERRRRSWLSIRLRTLLVLTLASGCLLGLIGREYRQGQRREDAARDLARAANKIEIEYCSFWGRKVDVPPHPWQRRLLGEHYFQRVTALVISSPSQLPDEGRQIGELRHLTSFELRGSNRDFTDRHAEALSRLPNLETVSLAGARITDEALRRLSPRQPIRSLDVSRTLVSDAGVEYLARLSTLERLDLTHTLVTNEGVKHLAGAPALKSLVLRRVMVSDEGVAALADSPALEHLVLAEMPLSGDAFAAVARASGMREVVAGGGTVFRGEKLAGLRAKTPHQELAVRTLGRPSVFWAIDREHCPRNTPYLNWLLEHGADPRGAKSGLSAAAILAGRNAVEPVAVLLEFGAELNPDRRASWRTPLAVAAERGQLEMVRFLLARGADPNSGDEAILVHAAYGRSLEIIRVLAAHGADVNRANPSGTTPLHVGVRMPVGSAEIVETLLELGADPNGTTDEGFAPLHLAAAAGNVEVVRLLLSHGADPAVKNSRGETPSLFARRHRSSSSATEKEILRLLSQGTIPDGTINRRGEPHASSR
jgi:hypothetical protein